MLNEEGFLSPQISNWVTVHRKRNADWLALARDLNRIAYKLTFVSQPKKTEENWKFVARLLFLKTHESFQAAIILAEHGLTGDAKTVLRSAFEALFCLGACKDDHIIEKLVSAELHFKKKTARGLLELPSDIGLDAESTEKLQRYLSTNPEKNADLNIWEMAQDAGPDLVHVYKVYYRDLSHSATHPSVTSLDRFVAKDEADNIVGLRQGPEVKDVGLTFAFACVVGFFMLKLMTDRFPNPEIEREIEAAFPQYSALIRQTIPEDGAKAA